MPVSIIATMTPAPEQHQELEISCWPSPCDCLDEKALQKKRIAPIQKCRNFSAPFFHHMEALKCHILHPSVHLFGDPTFILIPTLPILNQISGNQTWAGKRLIKSRLFHGSIIHEWWMDVDGTPFGVPLIHPIPSLGVLRLGAWD